MGSHIAVFPQRLSFPSLTGLALSQAAGLNAEDLLRVVNESAIASPMLALKVGGNVREISDVCTHFGAPACRHVYADLFFVCI